MTPWYVDDAVTVWHGDALDVLADMADNSVDAVVTDPPYGLGFMGKDWDSAAALHIPPSSEGRPTPHSRTRTGVGPKAVVFNGHAYQQWCQTWAEHCHRVLKPGGHLLAFGGTRTHHRLACAIEDAGFEIRDSIAWLYGSGFPKSLDVGKAIDRAAGAEREIPRSWGANGEGHDPKGTLTGRTRATAWCEACGRSRGSQPGNCQCDTTGTPMTDDARRWNGWGTALKPAHEPIVVARKPLAGTVAANVLTWGTGALNIDAARVEAQGRPLIVSKTEQSTGIYGDGLNGSTFAGTTNAGRWPPNVALDPHTAAALDQQVPNASYNRPGVFGSRTKDGEIFGLPAEGMPVYGYGDSGGASRFFPVFKYEPKAPTLERPRAPQEGAAGEVIARTVKQCSVCGSKTIATGPGGEPACGHGTWTHVDISVSKEYVAHPTVKPLDLMRWLVRLVTPPGGVVLDPFLGSGTTAEACIVEGFRCVGVEREPSYLPMIRARLTKPIQPVLDLGEL